MKTQFNFDIDPEVMEKLVDHIEIHDPSELVNELLRKHFRLDEENETNS